jgi:hypothetical protein
MTISNELQELVALRDAGHLSAAEFEAAKARLLGSTVPPASPVTYPAPQASSPAWSAGPTYPPPSVAPSWQQPAPVAVPGASRGQGYSDLNVDEHYRRKFSAFDARGGSFVASWNWPAFLFGVFWYLYRGMWAKALIIFAIVLISGGFMGIPLAIYVGLAGNYDYYLLKRRGTQLWS